jgi:hypothetical protein
MKHLFVALSTKGFGETTLGLRVARELHMAGDECAFLVHSAAASLLAGTPFEHMEISDHSVALLKLTLMTLLDQLKPASIVLSDYFTSALAFDRAGLDPAWLKEAGIPVGAIDTWDMAKSGTVIDVFGTEQRTIQDWSRLLDYRLVPVPIAHPDAAAGGPYYCNLPEPARATNETRGDVRRSLGIGSGDALILFCTAEWQHARFRSEHGNRLARLLPQLVAHWVEHLGGRVHLVHVGPAAYPLSLGERYHWLSPLPPAKFEAHLSSADLLMVANASSTTIAKALVSGVPSVTLMNSCTLETAAGLSSGASEGLVTWAREAAPLYPFYMWPLGYYWFLKPLLKGNPYCEVVPMLEILHETETLDAISTLLWDRQIRELHIARQAEYVSKLRLLPPGGALVARMASRQAGR